MLHSREIVFFKTVAIANDHITDTRKQQWGLL